VSAIGNEVDRDDDMQPEDVSYLYLTLFDPISMPICDQWSQISINIGSLANICAIIITKAVGKGEV